MNQPNLSEEKKLWRKGYKWVVGLDEAGRGPLAGPVVAAAVSVTALSFTLPGFVITKPGNVMSGSVKIKNLLKEIKDSKKLTPKKREEFYKLITKNPAIEWGIGRVSEKVIDRINILEATKLAMVKAVKNLENKNYVTRQRNYVAGLRNFIDFLILDGKMKLDIDIPQKSIVKADEKVFSCAAASIIAKVLRDRIMRRYHKKYPQYGFDRHKGYPTKFHKKMLWKYGPSVIHRKSFSPVKNVLK